MHAKYMTVDAKGRLTGKSRAVHGDLHLHNIFISDVDQTPQATLIDIETMAKSWEKPQDVAQDLRKFYLFTAQSFPFKKLSKSLRLLKELIKNVARNNYAAFLNGVCAGVCDAERAR
ncbi:MAG: hypothetical protein H6925_04515 [Holosporaceae bacterium]|nr:MAG: hypothetical protein H6925_04515 [Holosporaceae bacterium]